MGDRTVGQSTQRMCMSHRWQEERQVSHGETMGKTGEEGGGGVGI